MKIAKEVFYIPAFLVLIYLYDMIFATSNQISHYVLEFICLFFTGILIGFEKNIVFDSKWKFLFNVKRFFITFMPLFCMMLIVFWMGIIYLTGITFINLPNIFTFLERIVMYKQVGSVLLGYFITSNIELHIKAKSKNARELT